MNYRVNWRYKSGLGGPWQVGDLIDLDPLQAEAINHDSPGVLTPEIETRIVETPPQDRMVHKASRRHTVANEGAMDTDSFKAIRNKEE